MALQTDDLVSSCKDKLGLFRLKELKDVLHQLGLSKQGKKQELVERITFFLSDQEDIASKMNGWSKKKFAEKETVAKIIDDIFRKMQDPDLVPKSQTESVHNVKTKKKVDDFAQLDKKIRCPCGSSLATDSMIKCEDPQCNVWQHISCVIIPEKHVEGVPPEVPSCFYCEMCRINRADPFWVTITHPLLPVKIASSGIAPDGTYTLQYVEKTFPLSRANREMLQRAEYDLQVWCILLNDKVPFRMHWPLHADLQVNGVQIRVVNRPATQLLGANGRDDGPVITAYSREGPNKIILSRSDSRIFCFGIRIAKRRTVEQVLSLVPKEADGEKFDDALVRVRRCLGGGTETDNADSDSDIEVVADLVTVNLRCPMSGSRMKIAGRFKPCIHMGCFDLHAFVELNQRSRKWQCPICLKNYSLENIIIDPYFNRITSSMLNCGEDINEIDVKPDGSWRVKGGVDLELSQWHLPDGNSYVATDAEAKPILGNAKQEIKQEAFSEEHRSLKLGIKKNNNGQWEITKSEDFHFSSSGNDVPADYENKNSISVSGNAAGNYGNAGNKSVNMEQGHFGYHVCDVHDLDSAVHSDLCKVDEHVPAAPKVDVIVLSDSDDDNITLISPRAVHFNPALDTGMSYPPNPPETSGIYDEEPGIRKGGTSYLGLNEDSDDFGLSFWDYQIGPQNGPPYQLFDSGTNVTDVQNYPINCHSLDEPVSGSNLGAAEDNHLQYDQNDSLQAYLSGETNGGTVQANSNGHGEIYNDGRSDSWISLSLGGAGGSCVNANMASRKRINSGEQLSASDASILRGMNDEGVSETTSRGQRSYSPFSPPRQPRSVRQRLILPIDSDSD